VQLDIYANFAKKNIYINYELSNDI
jgi:hypothetical protein